MPTIAEAALTLGLSNDTIRRRIKTGEIGAQLINGRYNVELPKAATTAGTEAPGLPWEKLVTTLEGDIEELRRQLEAREREVQELHVLLQTAQTALTAPKEGINSAWWQFWK